MKIPAHTRIYQIVDVDDNVMPTPFALKPHPQNPTHWKAFQ